MKRKIYVYSFLLLFVSMTFLTGCAARKAASVRRWHNLRGIENGKDRPLVLKKLGDPVQAATPDQREDVFELNRGNLAFAYARVVAHSLLDMGTLGLWELLATPFEEWMEQPREVTVEYDSNDKVVDFSRDRLYTP